MSNAENSEIITKDLSIWNEFKRVNFGFTYNQSQQFFISKVKFDKCMQQIFE